MWCNFNYFSVDHGVTESHSYLQVIWCNSNIPIGSNQMFWDNFRHTRVIYISDLSDENLEFKSIENFNLELGINMSSFDVVSMKISNSKKLMDNCR